MRECCWNCRRGIESTIESSVSEKSRHLSHLVAQRNNSLRMLGILEVVREVVKEVADLRIVAVAQDGLALEVLGVMPQLLLDVGELGVKLVLLGRLGGMQTSI